MNIAYLTAGAAGMYCGTCMHDNTLAQSLIDRGHEVSLIPAYTPTRTDEANVAESRIVFGALNVYLQQRSSYFRRHRWLDRLIDSPRVLRWIGKLSGSASTDATMLGSMTLSMLEGESGHQARELEKLIDFLEEIVRPDLVHLSHTLFAGFARRIRERLDVPVVASLAGEDLFFDELEEPWHGRVETELRRRVRDVDAFTSPCRWYGERMSRDFGIPGERIHVVPLGIVADDFRSGRPLAETPMHQPPTIGYLARMAPEKGLHVLIDAFRDVATAHADVRLRLAGYLGAKDRDYVEEQKAKVEQWGLSHRVDWVGEVDREQKVDFLADLDLFSVPTVYREPKGLFVPEALASGVPVVLPRHGSFPEWVEATGGGVLVDPESPSALAAALLELLGDPARRSQLGAAGRAVVRRRFDREQMTDQTLALYDELVGTRRSAASAA
ncbi:MAG: glycosyltransferase family 4 protein [Acidobacteriota bacterium]